MTSQDEPKIQTAQKTDDDLESFRRLIELQKQMVEMAQQHERTKRECAALRERVLDEATALLRPRRNWLRWLRRSLSSMFRSGATFWNFSDENTRNKTAFLHAPSPTKKRSPMTAPLFKISEIAFKPCVVRNTSEEDSFFTDRKTKS